MINTLGFIFGLIISLPFFGGVVLTLFYGFPKCFALAIRKQVSWRAPTLQLRAPLIWLPVCLGINYAIGYLQTGVIEQPQHSVFSVGLFLGIAVWAINTALSPSTRNDIALDFAAFIAPYFLERMVHETNAAEDTSPDRATPTDARISFDKQRSLLLRLDINMHYLLDKGIGAASVNWTLLDKSRANEEAWLRCILITFLYTRVLCIHPEDSSRLFELVEAGFQSFLGGDQDDDLQFGAWHLDLDVDPPIRLWPWFLLKEEDLKYNPVESKNPKELKRAVAVLWLSSPSHISPSGLRLDFSFPKGMERVHVPSSVLIGSAFCHQDLDLTHRLAFSKLMLNVNRFYQSAENATLLSDAKAASAALEWTTRAQES